MLENPKSTYLHFKQLGLVQSYLDLSDDFGRKLNSESRKLVKASKVSYSHFY